MKTILVIENDPDTLDIMDYMISDMGFNLVRSSSWLSPEKIILLKPNLILIDQQLDEGKGSDLCLHLKFHTLTKNIPVILVSAATGLKELAKDGCADAYIEKPFELTDLEKMLIAFSA
jgi:two-component system, OmpR family, phosphate regulon response regulator PhoB